MLDAAQLPAFQSLLTDVGEWWQAQYFDSVKVDRILSDLDKGLAGQVEGKGLATGTSPLLWPVSVVGVTRERFLVGQIFKALSSMRSIAGAFHVAALVASSQRGGGGAQSAYERTKNLGTTVAELASEVKAGGRRCDLLCMVEEPDNGRVLFVLEAKLNDEQEAAEKSLETIVGLLDPPHRPHRPLTVVPLYVTISGSECPLSPKHAVELQRHDVAVLEQVCVSWEDLLVALLHLTGDDEERRNAFGVAIAAISAHLKLDPKSLKAIPSTPPYGLLFWRVDKLRSLLE